MEPPLNREKLYSNVVHYYVDKKGYKQDDANRIAQSVVSREMRRRTCMNTECGHSFDDHISNKKLCLKLGCNCQRFISV